VWICCKHAGNHTGPPRGAYAGWYSRSFHLNVHHGCTFELLLLHVRVVNACFCVCVCICVSVSVPVCVCVCVCLCVAQGEGKSTVVPIKLLGVRPTRTDDGNWYVTLGASKLALRIDRDGSISDRLLLEDVIRGKIPALAGPNVSSDSCHSV
jgi:hypothetical protein